MTSSSDEGEKWKSAFEKLRALKLRKLEAKKAESPLFTVRFQSPELEIDCAVSDSDFDS